MQLGLGLAGAAIGSTFGAASIGWSIGSFLGGMLESKSGSDRPDVFGPRLTELKVQTSAYGVSIPYAWGVMRLSGNVIWGPPIVETQTRTVVNSGGKGGGPSGTSEAQVTFSYSASFAVGILGKLPNRSAAIVGIRKVWANGKLIQDIGEDAPLEAVLGSIPGTVVYTGTDTQTADPTIEAAEGAGNVPGFRDLAYIVFNTLQLAEFGNRLPNLEFEVVTVGGFTDDFVLRELYTLPTSNWTDDEGIKTHSRIMTQGVQFLWTIEEVAGDAKRLSRFNNYTHQLVEQHDLPNDTFIWGIGRDNRLWYADSSSTLYARNFEGDVASYANSVSYTRVDLMFEEPMTFSGGNPILWLSFNSPTPGVNQVRRFRPALNAVDIMAVTPSCALVYLAQGATNIPGRIYVCTGDATFMIGYFDLENLQYTAIRTYTSSEVPWPMVGRDGYIYCRSKDTGQGNVFEKMDPDGNVVDSVVLSNVSATPSSTLSDEFVQDVHGNMYLLVHVNLNPIFRINYGTMDVLASAVNVLSDHDQLMHEDAFEGSRVLLTRAQPGGPNNVVRYLDLARITASTVFLDDIVTDLCSLVDGLGPSRIDVDDLASIEVIGYIVPRRTTVRGMVEPLMGAYQFDAVGSDKILKFVIRGASSAASIGEEELAARQDNLLESPDRLNEVRRHEIDLPQSIDVNYIDAGFDYQPVPQSDRRLVTSSQQSISLNLPIVLSPDEALGIASKNLYTAWLERNQYEFSTSRKYLALEPTDVVTVTVDSVDHVLRIVRRDEGGNGILKFAAVLDDGDVYDQEGEGVDKDSGTADISIVGPTNAFFIDAPLLRREDDYPGYYFAANGYTNGWSGTQLFSSVDGGVNYDPVPGGVLVARGTVGYTSSALADYDGPDMFDESSKVTVVMENGSLSSVTRDRLFSSTDNTAIIGDEPVRFRDAVLVAADTYEVSGFLRGQLGAEEFMTGHLTGERFILLEYGTMLSVQQSLVFRNSVQYFKPVSIGGNVDATVATQFINTERRLLPLAPVGLGAGKAGNGDCVLHWVRRSRYSSGWIDGSDAPLGETSEVYEVDILDDSDNVLRTLTVTNSQQVAYTNAQQQEDFGSERAHLEFIVYQMSAAVGRGYGGRGIMDTTVAPRIAAYWRFSAFQPPLGASNIGHQFAEIKLYDSIGVQWVDGTTVVTGTAATASSGPGTPTIATTLNDSDLDTDSYWNQSISAGLTLTFQLAAPHDIRQIQFGARNSSTTWPTNVTIEDSLDGITWRQVHVGLSMLTYPGGFTYGPLLDIF